MWQVLGFFFLENKLHPVRLLGIPLCTHTGHCHHCAPGWSHLELVMCWGCWLTESGEIEEVPKMNQVKATQPGHTTGGGGISLTSI